MKRWHWHFEQLTAPQLMRMSCVAFAITVLCLTGCQEDIGYKYTTLTGRVTLDGEPVQKGTITFYPVESGHGSGGTAQILDGKYRLERVPVGKNGFTFAALVETGNFIEGPSGVKEPEKRNAIPEKYSDQGLVREISQGDSHDFELESQ